MRAHLGCEERTNLGVQVVVKLARTNQLRLETLDMAPNIVEVVRHALILVKQTLQNS